MKLILVCFCFLIIDLFSLVSCTNKERDKNASIKKESDLIVAKFFDQIQSGKYKDALDNLIGSNPNISLTDSATVKLKDGFKLINEYSGKYTGNKLLKERAIENDVLIRSYLVKYEKRFYRFTFIFYKADKVVNIFQFAYDDSINLELEESIKLYT